MITPTSAAGKLVDKVRTLIADVLVAQYSAYYPAGEVATRELALRYTERGGRKVEDAPGYPYFTVFLGNKSSRLNPAEAVAQQHYDGTTDVMVDVWFKNTPGLADTDDPYLDALNFVCGVMEDDLLYTAITAERSQSEEYPRIRSINMEIGPGVHNESETDTDGSIIDPVWYAAFTLECFGVEEYAERQA